MKLNKITRTCYNARGGAFQFTDLEGTVTAWTSDCAGRRTQLIENVTTPTGHLLSAKKYATDTGSHFLQWHYNQLGEVRRQQDANGTRIRPPSSHLRMAEGGLGG